MLVLRCVLASPLHPVFGLNPTGTTAEIVLE